MELAAASPSCRTERRTSPGFQKRGAGQREGAVGGRGRETRRPGMSRKADAEHNEDAEGDKARESPEEEFPELRRRRALGFRGHTECRAGGRKTAWARAWRGFRMPGARGTPRAGGDPWKGKQAAGRQHRTRGAAGQHRRRSEDRHRSSRNYAQLNRDTGKQGKTMDCF